jgi:hypothetical protein
MPNHKFPPVIANPNINIKIQKRICYKCRAFLNQTALLNNHNSGMNRDKYVAKCIVLDIFSHTYSCFTDVISLHNTSNVPAVPSSSQQWLQQSTPTVFLSRLTEQGADVPDRLWSPQRKKPASQIR